MSNNGSYVGRVVRDAELKYTQDGKAVVNVSIASDVGFGNNKTTLYPKVVLWGKQAEALTPYLKKGQEIVAYGEITEASIWNSNGKSGVNLILTSHKIQLVGSRSESTSTREEEVVETDEIPF
jgi:single-strand DNA-binding protein